MDKPGSPPWPTPGVDIFHCSQRRFWEPEFEGSDLNFAGWAKKLTGKATITVGSVGLSGEFIASASAAKLPFPLSSMPCSRRWSAATLISSPLAGLSSANPDWAQKDPSGPHLGVKAASAANALATLVITQFSRDARAAGPFFYTELSRG